MPVVSKSAALTCASEACKTRHCTCESGVKSDIGTITYDPTKLGPWRVPRTAVNVPLPSKLRRTVEDWVFAGAAVSTCLERIHILDEEAIERFKLRVLYSGRASETSRRSSIYQLVAIDNDYDQSAGPSRPPSSSNGQVSGNEGKASVFASATTSTQTPHLSSPAADYVDFSKLTLDPPGPSLGMESPPFTPVETHGDNTPRLIATCVFPSNENVRASQACSQHSSNESSTMLFEAGAPPSSPPLTSRRSSMYSLSNAHVTQFEANLVVTDPENFNTIAWENFTRVHRAERHHLNMVAMPRLRRCTNSINRQLEIIAKGEIRHGKREDVDVEAIVPFTDWWLDEGNSRHAQIEELAKTVQVPVVDLMPDLHP